ncbi:MAG: saccharopine dehydrogenase C-terminal domain-containing protein [Flavobacteriales bacterium]|nr:saccharopine dehydrogenase C-terminal domain-containing protein [Flavobacteriales bacterium]|tara:strand:- start:74 stop:1177 length:1104 start_codon:yes stop_codon:yes gene_type:complete
MANIIVLGAGLVGGVMATDLSKHHEVTSIDISQKNLDKLAGINTICADVSDTSTLQNLIKDFDLVVGAVPGFMGYKMMKDVIESGKNIVDISFYPEDPFGLDELAKEKGVVAVMDCGVAPGMGNIIFGHHDSQMQITDYECLVGGLPEKREWPYEYQAVFSPIDVIEEYIRPARYVQNSHMVTKEALSDTELIEFDEIGTLESWNSDGLRSLIKTMDHVPNMIEKTLRYPGCVEYLKVLRESGFFSYDEVEVNGNMIRPIDVTSKLLFPKWEMKDGDKDFTVMRIIMKGTENGEEVTYKYNLLDRFQDGTISMARTTGFTCTAVANLVVNGKYKRIGISPPEYLGEHFNFVKNYLEERGVNYKVKKN